MAGILFSDTMLGINGFYRMMAGQDSLMATRDYVQICPLDRAKRKKNVELKISEGYKLEIEL